MHETCQELDRIIADNLYAMSLQLGRIPGGAAYDTTALKWAYTGTVSSNRVLGARFAATEAEARVATMTALARSWRAVVYWIIDPLSTPNDLGDHLLRHGWEEFFSWRGMALPADRALPQPTQPAEVTFRRVTDAAALRTWTEVFNADAAQASAAAADAFTRVFCALGYGEDSPWTHYLAWQHDRPVATSLLFREGGVAGLYWIKTIPSCRRQGIGTALTHYTAAQARQEGYSLIVLQASPMGAPVYRSLGFQECGMMRLFRIFPPE